MPAALNVLLVHNHYRSALPSGENAVFAAEAALLRAAGHRVIEFVRSNDEWATHPARTLLAATVLAPWNPLSYRQLRQCIAREAPDVIHFHNTFPLLSPSVIAAARHSGAVRIATLHNYRLFCATGVATRDGAPCLDCLRQHSVLPALRHACYRGSRLATAPVAATIALHRRLRTWSDGIDAFITMTDFQRARLIEAGLPAERIHIKPHSTPDPGAPLPWARREPRAVFLGRLSEEKGLLTLLDAWARLGTNTPPLDIIGDGPLREVLAQRIEQAGLRGKITLTGQLEQADALARLAQARLLLLPSLAYETFGLPAIEAMARGVPLLASDIGHFPELFGASEGTRLFPARDSAALAATASEIWQDTQALERMSAAARSYYLDHFSPQANLRRLQAIYQHAREAGAPRRVPAKVQP